MSYSIFRPPAPIPRPDPPPALRLPDVPTALVTGANGFLGLEIVKQLLEKGYHVRASVRDVQDAKKTTSLVKVGRALPGLLEIVQLDLSEESAFDAAVAGTAYVFHVASPSPLRNPTRDPHRDVVELAVGGVRRLLRAVARASPRPARVVLTSSTGAVAEWPPAGPPPDGTQYTERDWNHVSKLSTDPIGVAKVLAEVAAGEIARSEDIDLVTVVPGCFVGPPIDPGVRSSSVWIANILRGRPPGFPPLTTSDVRDVARAHVAAAENPDARGRYIVCGRARFDPNWIIRWLREDYPDRRFADVPHELAEFPDTWDVSRAREDLGFRAPIPLRTSYRDTTRALLAHGAATLPPPIDVAMEG